jgi:hypothetical protein
LRIEVRCGNDHYNDVQTVVVFIIEEATAAEIIRLAAIVKANNLYKVERFDYRAKYVLVVTALTYLGLSPMLISKSCRMAYIVLIPSANQQRG